MATPANTNVTSGAAAHHHGRPMLRFNKPQEHGPGWESKAERDQYEGPYDRTAKHRDYHTGSAHTSRPGSVRRASYTGDKERRTDTDASAKDGKDHHHHHRHHGRKARKVAKEITHDILAVTGEFFGTFLFLFMSFMGAQSATFNRGGTGGGDQTVTTNDNQTILFIALSFGMSLLVVAWTFFRITGSAFNPAVTLALWLIGGLSARRAAGIAIAQFVGGIAAAAVVKGVTIGNFAVSNALTPGVSTGQGLGIELLTTAMLVFTVLMTAAEKSKATFLAPVAIGLALFVGHLASIGWTGAGINPARTLGPSVVTPGFPGNAWLYYVGQFLGSLVATLAYTLLKFLDYTEVSGDIDTDAQDASANVASAPMTNLLNAMPGVQLDQNNDNDAASVASVPRSTREPDLEAGPDATTGRMSRESAMTESTSVAR
ncbi:Aquaporin-1 [Microbotryomycetes sp. JL201]|nr:Aquaporin-1 [Microbotryomycetes sp. JL201]